MTIHNEKNYLEDQYLETEYLTSHVRGANGIQVQVQIDKTIALGAQFKSAISDYLKGLGQQFSTTILDKITATGIQFSTTIESLEPIGMQFKAEILDYLGSLGAQAQVVFADKLNSLGLQFLVEIKDNPSGLAEQFNLIYTESTGPLGSQFTSNVAAKTPFGTQFLSSITDKKNGLGIQFFSNILDKKNGLGIQSNQVIADVSNATGMQFEAHISDELHSTGVQFSSLITKNDSTGIQFEAQILEFKKALGIEFYKNVYFHQWAGYLVDEYLVGSYLVKAFNVFIPIQFSASIINYKNPLGIQFQAVIEHKEPLAVQFEAHINDKPAPLGIQFQAIMKKLNALGTQFQGVVENSRATGMQFLGIMNKLKPLGVQFTSVESQALGAQFRCVLYNTTNLRVLYEFPSRGTSPSNWAATTTAAGDFSVDNINTDIVEEVWRGETGILTSVFLDCDSGLTQGIYMDTLAILNHNLTTSANVVLLGSNDPLFGSVGLSLNLIMTKRNYIYIAPELPLASYRYWRIIISDSSNPDNYLQIGTILFGSCICLQGENFSNPIQYKKQHFVDAIETEGFTTAQNDRGIKAKVSLDFQSLNFSGGNYTNLQDIFETVRTNLKALWIPTPQYPLRYGVFGKLTELPQETHLDNGLDADYVNLSIEIDEAK